MKRAALCLCVAGLASPGIAEAQSRLPRVMVWEDALRGTEEEQLRWPTAVAARSASEFAVGDAFEPRLMVFGKVGVSWQLQQTVPLPGPPVALVWDGGRYVASLRRGEGLVAIDGSTFDLRPISLPSGVVPGSLAVTLDRRHILVHDLNKEEVFRLARDGSVSAGTAVASRITGLAATSAGGFYAALGEQSAVLRYDAEGMLETRFEVPGEGPVPSWPIAVTVDAGGVVAVADRHNSRILLFDNEGRILGAGSRRGWEPGLLLFPRAMARLPGGRLVVADEGNGRAQIFRRTDRGATP